MEPVADRSSAEEPAGEAAEEVEVDVARGADWPWAVVAVGGAMIVGAAVTGGLTLARQAELDAVCTPHSCPPSVADAQAEGRALAFATDALWAGGLVVGLAGVVLSLALPREAPAPRAVLACSAEGCAVALGGTF